VRTVQSLKSILMSAHRSVFVLIAIAAVTCCAPSVCAQEFELNDQTFNQWLFSASQGQFDPNSELTLNLEAIDRACGLSEDQKSKLRIAGQGDYARFGRQVDELRAEFVGKTYNQNEIGNIYQKIQPLGQIYQAGLLGNSSLFSKVLANTLTLEQAAKFDRIAEERERARYSAKVRMFVVTVERTCPLTDKQRTALVELLLAETKPPKRFGQYDWYVIMYYASKVPDQRFETILDEAQMRQFKQTLRQGAAMEHFLRQQKFIDE
jgi:hypothetical protein